MEKLSMCRICLVEDVRMFVIANKSLQEVYEKLTDIPFVTEDRRPMLACFHCCTKLKQCCQLQRKCMEAEEVLAQMLNEEYEKKPLRNSRHQEFMGGFIITPIENISVVDGCQIGSDAVKQELAAVSDEQYDVEIKKKHLTEEHAPGNLDISHPDLENVPAHHSESDSEDGELVMEIKIEGEEVQEFEQQQRVRESAPASKILNLVPQNEDTEKSVSLKHKNNGQEHSKNTENSKNSYFKSINKTEKTISSRIVIKGKPKVTDDTLCNNKDAIKTISKENTASLLCDKINKNEFKCKICNYKGNNSSDIKRHSLRHTNVCAKDTPYTCDICQKSFTEKWSLKRHIRTHSGEKPYKCDVCQSRFTENGYLKRHNIRDHSGDTLLKCNMCQSSFNYSFDLKRHNMRIHSSEKPYACDICQSSYIEKWSLERHIRTHSGESEKPYECNICQKRFYSKGHLNVHFRTHSGEKPYKCNICQSSFAAVCNLKRHIRTHSGEKPYKCDVCQTSFTQKCTLERHIRLHSGKKPYKCNICQKCFNLKSYLIAHVRTHSGEKPFKCNICQKCFTLKVNLNIHIRKHTGEIPYKCNICQSSFSTKRDLNTHLHSHCSRRD